MSADLSIEEQFFQNSRVVSSGCWEWQRARTDRNYGMAWHGGKMRRAHRAAYEMCVGPIPAGLEVMHDCDNPPCVNPAHLQVGTGKDNAQDRKQKGRNGKQTSEGAAGVKLTWEEVHEMRALYKNGMALLSELAEKYSVSVSNVSMIVNNKHWKVTP